jgi:integrase
MKGHIRQRGKRSWAVVLDVGRDANGKRRQKWHPVKGTKKDAQREMARLLHTIYTGAYVEPSRMTLREYLELWLKDYAATHVSAKTSERYDEIVRIHVIPSLGHHALAKLHPLHIQACYSEALQKGRKYGKGGLSAQTVLHLHRVLREALQHAVRLQLLARNPADAVEPPRPQRREMKYLDEASTARLLQAADGTALYLPILLAVTTGMRRGEILGVRWQDLDLDAATLSVRQSLEQTKIGLAFKQPKTQKSRRVVALPNMTVEVLRRHRLEQVKYKLLFGPDYHDQDLVCARANGSPWPPDSFTSSFSEFIRKTSVSVVRFHDLRHTHATHLLRHGIHPKVVSERLGHSTVGITLDVYSHVLPDMQEEAARRVDAALRLAVSQSASEPKSELGSN